MTFQLLQIHFFHNNWLPPHSGNYHPFGRYILASKLDLCLLLAGSTQAVKSMIRIIKVHFKFKVAELSSQLFILLVALNHELTSIHSLLFLRFMTITNCIPSLPHVLRPAMRSDDFKSRCTEMHPQNRWNIFH